MREEENPAGRKNLMLQSSAVAHVGSTQPKAPRLRLLSQEASHSMKQKKKSQVNEQFNS